MCQLKCAVERWAVAAHRPAVRYGVQEDSVMTPVVPLAVFLIVCACVWVAAAVTTYRDSRPMRLMAVVSSACCAMSVPCLVLYAIGRWNYPEIAVFLVVIPIVSAVCAAVVPRPVASRYAYRDATGDVAGATKK
jgi:hypothetical protein